jgi:Secretion system C-terminal sorting domain
LTILSIILLTGTAAMCQSRTGGTPEPAVKLVKFYPNPATSNISFDFQKGYDKTYSFQIINMLGKKLYEIPSVTPKTVVNLAEFNRGLYIFQLRDKSGRLVESGKFQVVK